MIDNNVRAIIQVRDDTELFAMPRDDAKGDGDYHAIIVGNSMLNFRGKDIAATDLSLRRFIAALQSMLPPTDGA